jgi:acyl-CoA thioesterase YciA
MGLLFQSDSFMPTPKGYDLIARHIVAVKDLGAADRLFGGVMLSWLDEAGAAYAITQAGVSSLVTRHIEAMNFLAPGREGDVLAIYGRVSKVGTTSISIEMKVFAEDPSAGATREIVTTTFVFVAVDKRGKKTPLKKQAQPS